jgi:hypothetical protein
MTTLAEPPHQVEPIMAGAATRYLNNSISWMVGAWGLEPQTSTVSMWT